LCRGVLRCHGLLCCRVQRSVRGRTPDPALVPCPATRDGQPTLVVYTVVLHLSSLPRSKGALGAIRTHDARPAYGACASRATGACPPTRRTPARRTHHDQCPT